MTIGTVTIVVWLVKAVRDANGQITGSEITYAFSVNPGGSIPKSMTEGQGPKTAIGALKGLIKHLTTKK